MLNKIGIIKRAALLSLLLLGGCATNYQDYEGDRLPADQNVILRSQQVKHPYDPFGGGRSNDYPAVMRIDDKKLFIRGGAMHLQPGRHELEVAYIPGFANGGVLLMLADYMAGDHFEWAQHPARKRAFSVDFKPGGRYHLQAKPIRDKDGGIMAADFSIVDLDTKEILAADQGRYDPERDRRRFHLSTTEEPGRLIVQTYQRSSDSGFATYLVKINDREPLTISDAGESEFILDPGDHQIRFSYGGEEQFDKPVKPGDSNVITVSITPGSTQKIHYKGHAWGRGGIFPRPPAEMDGYETAKAALARYDEKTKSAASPNEPRTYTIIGREIPRTEFLPLAGDFYYLLLTPKAGTHATKVGRKDYRIKIPKFDDGSTYLFLLDASDPKRLSMSYFNKKFADELGYSF